MPGEFFFDTYALVEIVRGSGAYRPFAGTPIVTHQANLYELIVQILRDHSEAQVRRVIGALHPNLLDADLDDLIQASHFKIEHARARISYVDSLGYTLAHRYGLRFLTGDELFADLPGVEYVR